MIDGNDVIQHLSPAWQDKADFIIKGRTEDDLPKAWEQLWAKQLGTNSFQICCIPFALYGIDLGDIVATDDYYVVVEVIEPSSHSTFRVWFEEEESVTERERNRERVLKTVKDRLGCLVEWYSRNLLAIDAQDANQAEELAAFLHHMARPSTIIFESGDA